MTDLGVSSEELLTKVRPIIAKALDIQISNEEAEKFKVVSDLLRYLEEKSPAKD